MGCGGHPAEHLAPQVSFVVRIVPSPDWFVGVDSLDLCDGNRWREQVTVDLYPHDAGTDSGFTFSSPNFATIPQDTVTEVRGRGSCDSTGHSGPLQSPSFVSCLDSTPVCRVMVTRGVVLPRRKLAALQDGGYKVGA